MPVAGKETMDAMFELDTPDRAARRSTDLRKLGVWNATAWRFLRGEGTASKLFVWRLTATSRRTGEVLRLKYSERAIVPARSMEDLTAVAEAEARGQRELESLVVLATQGVGYLTDDWTLEASRVEAIAQAVLETIDTLSDPYPDDTRERIEEAVARGIEQYERRVDWLTQLGADKDPDHPERGWRVPIEPIS